MTKITKKYQDVCVKKTDTILKELHGVSAVQFLQIIEAVLFFFFMSTLRKKETDIVNDVLNQMKYNILEDLSQKEGFN